MASLPKTRPEDPPGQELDFSKVGTPEFEAEYLRQLLAIAKHERETGNADRLRVDWAAMDEWQ